MVSEPNKSAESSDKGDVPAVNGAGKEVTVIDIRSAVVKEMQQEIHLLVAQNSALDALVQEKTDKLRRMQIATYKITTTKQYQLIEKEAEKVQLVQENKPQDYFYFPKIGMQLCQCGHCGLKGDYKEEDYLYYLTGIGHFSGHSGFKIEDARYIAEFLNKHPEYMHKLENLDKDRFA